MLTYILVGRIILGTYALAQTPFARVLQCRLRLVQGQNRNVNYSCATKALLVPFCFDVIRHVVQKPTFVYFPLRLSDAVLITHFPIYNYRRPTDLPESVGRNG